MRVGRLVAKGKNVGQHPPSLTPEGYTTVLRLGVSAKVIAPSRTPEGYTTQAVLSKMQMVITPSLTRLLRKGITFPRPRERLLQKGRSVPSPACGRGLGRGRGWLFIRMVERS